MLVTIIVGVGRTQFGKPDPPHVIPSFFAPSMSRFTSSSSFLPLPPVHQIPEGCPSTDPDQIGRRRTN